MSIADNIALALFSAVVCIVWRLNDYPDTSAREMLIGTSLVTASALLIANLWVPQ